MNIHSFGDDTDYINTSPLSVSESNSSEDEIHHSSYGGYSIEPISQSSGVHFEVND